MCVQYLIKVIFYQSTILSKCFEVTEWELATFMNNTAAT